MSAARGLHGTPLANGGYNTEAGESHDKGKYLLGGHGCRDVGLGRLQQGRVAG
jgi:hypothetical protein